MASESVAFDRAVEYYDATRGFPPGEEKRVAALIAEAGRFNQSSRLLEIGVGTGRIALPLASLVGSYYGADISRPMMERLRAKPGSSSIGLTEADATQLPFAPHSFDAAVAVHVFHLIPGWQTVLSELARVLRPGAPLVHCWTREEDEFRPLWDAWNTILPSKADTAYGVHWRKRPEFLQEEGWQPAGELMTYAYTHQTSPQLFLEQLRGRIWAACWRYTDDELERGLAVVETAVAAIYPNPEAPIDIHTTVCARAYLPPA